MVIGNWELGVSGGRHGTSGILNPQLPAAGWRRGGAPQVGAAELVEGVGGGDGEEAEPGDGEDAEGEGRAGEGRFPPGAGVGDVTEPEYQQCKHPQCRDEGVDQGEGQDGQTRRAGVDAEMAGGDPVHESRRQQQAGDDQGIPQSFPLDVPVLRGGGEKHAPAGDRLPRGSAHADEARDGEQAAAQEEGEGDEEGGGDAAPEDEALGMLAGDGGRGVGDGEGGFGWRGIALAGIGRGRI